MKCLECSTRISRGKTGCKRKELNSTAMKNHLKKVHPDLWVALQTEEAAAAEVAAAEKQRIQEKDETAKSTVQIFRPRPCSGSRPL